MKPIDQLHQLGQSIWYDNIQRSMIENGTMAAMIARGEIRGVTSNPAIFHNAISKSHDYDAALIPMAWSGWETEQIFYQLAIEDIRAAADLFRDLYAQSAGGDGYVSLEVSPTLARNTMGTLAEAKRLWALVNRPNLMIKIPATREGIPAIRSAIAAGINVNVTLIFSIQRYHEVMDAYISGLEDRLAAGQPIGMIASVASFFVSRVDGKIDPLLQSIVAKGGEEALKASKLLGKAAIANARDAYQAFRHVFGADRFKRLQTNGARFQRPLWASTSTKNPAYRDVIYVEELIGADTVNTVPPQTLIAFREHGLVRASINDIDRGVKIAVDLAKLGISIDQVTDELEAEGVKAFADAFEALLKTLDERRIAARAELAGLADVVAARVAKLEQEQFPRRLHAHDPALWTEDPAGQAEIIKRMGWLEAPKVSLQLVAEVNICRNELRKAGITHAVLLGMGGSSLAPEVMRLVNGVGPDGLDLLILDSTDPAQVAAAANWAPADKTVYIVSSKSGGTAEVNAFLDYFWKLAQDSLGELGREHFVAITDPGTELENSAKENKFGHIFYADPNVGGRNSALTAFGVVPAGLIGLDLEKFLAAGSFMAAQCAADVPAGRNPGLVLGAILGEAALAECDKVTFVADPLWAPMGPWLEQLIAESSGKQGRGILPIADEPHMAADRYSSDRIFIHLRSSGEQDEFVASLRSAGHTVLTLNAASNTDLAAEFYRWEIATCVACSIIGVNSFDQPDVQDSKDRTYKNIAHFISAGKFDDGTLIWQGEGVQVKGTHIDGVEKAASLQELVQDFLAQAHSGDYVALTVYFPRNLETLAELQTLRSKVQTLTGLATTLGFGPRFLHSTGQLHKGGPNSGLFLQITSESAKDIPIPGQGLGFATLERAQALGDFDALVARGRRVIHIHLKDKQVQEIL